jgi:formylglycine-generating enzyme required for sulfatase activity
MPSRAFSRVCCLLVTLVTACASTTRAPVAPQVTETDQEATEASDEGTPDTDGEPEVTDEPAAAATTAGPCPANMALVTSESVRVCVDKYEGSLVEVGPDGSEKPYPHWLPVDGHTVRAVSQPGVFPQGYISEVQAEDACAASGKRLCTHAEWKTACMGPSKTTFPYGNARQPGVCHDTGKSAVAAVFGSRAMTDPVATKPVDKPAVVAGVSSKQTSRPAEPVKGRAASTTRDRATRSDSKHAALAKSSTARSQGGTTAKSSGASKATRVAASRASRKAARSSARPASVEPSVWTQLNDPRLGQVDGALARTGSHEECVNEWGVVDMVGNIHEWVKTPASAPHGTFAGGYYLDTSLNGDGCQYRTTAHAHDYHDYSTGFRCCAEPQATDP